MADRVPGEDLDAAGVTGRGGFDPTASAGLFVGVSTFEDERILEIPYAVDDAVDLAHLFAIELGLVAPERAVLLLAGEAKKAASAERLAILRACGARLATARQRDIYRHLAELVESVRPGGLAVVSVATHGVSDAGGDFLVATDSLADRKLRTGIAVAEMFDEAARAGRGLVFLDACRERLIRNIRGEGAGTPAIGKGFAEAIANAQGLVVLSGATLGGFSYDDPKLGNGVFTAAVLEGLHGGAAPGPGGWITVRTLADFVQEKVVAWVRKEWPGHAERSLGIGKRIEASAEDLPLVPHPSATRERERYRERRKKALARVHEVQGEVLSGSHWDQVRSMLPAEEPSEQAEKLLEEIEALDGGVRSQRGLRDYLRELAGEAVVVPPPARPTVPFPVAARAQQPMQPVVPPVVQKKEPVPESRPSEPERRRRDEEGKKLGWEKKRIWAASAAAGLLALVLGWAVVGKIREEPAGATIEPVETAQMSPGTEITSDAPQKPSENKVPPEPSEEKTSDPAPREPEAGARWQSPSGMSFLYVPSGTYQLGSPPFDGIIESRYTAKLTRGLWLGETEVTQAQWAQLVPTAQPWTFKTCGPDCPVENVSWYAAAMFANFLSDKEGLARCYSFDFSPCTGNLDDAAPSDRADPRLLVSGQSPVDPRCKNPPRPSLDCPGYRLPTESEWEVAARSANPKAEVVGLASYAWFVENSGGSVHPVGKKKPNPWGFHDMLGNVWEWTEDWSSFGWTRPAIDPQGPARGSDRVLRGGSWNDGPRYVRAAYIYALPPSSRADNTGFRLARGRDPRSGTSR